MRIEGGREREDPTRATTTMGSLLELGRAVRKPADVEENEGEEGGREAGREGGGGGGCCYCCCSLTMRRSWISGGVNHTAEQQESRERKERKENKGRKKERKKR